MAWTRIKNLTVKFDDCPFCHGGETIMLENPQTPHFLMIAHLPDAGVNCPARFEQVVDTQALAAQWWNDRSKKGEAK